MSNCSNHSRELFGEKDMKKVAEAIGDLHYEVLADLFNELYLKLNEDGTNDYNAGRKELSRHLLAGADSVYDAHYRIKRAWLISKPFMDDNTLTK